jgi:alpha-glucosidase
MYLDDGVSRSSAPDRPPSEGGDDQAAGEYRHTRITHSYPSPGHREIRVERVHDQYTPFEGDFRIAVLHDPAEPKGPSGPVSRLSVDGQQLEPLAGATAAERAAAFEASQANAWYYDDRLNRSVIKIIDDRPARLVQLSCLEGSS